MRGMDTNCASTFFHVMREIRTSCRTNPNATVFTTRHWPKPARARHAV
jgi:N-formylglutamate amidohydrolase